MRIAWLDREYIALETPEEAVFAYRHCSNVYKDEDPPLVRQLDALKDSAFARTPPVILDPELSHFMGIDAAMLMDVLDKCAREEDPCFALARLMVAQVYATPESLAAAMSDDDPYRMSRPYLINTPARSY